MPAVWDFAKVSEAFVDAAIDPARWDAAMEVAAAATGSLGAVLLPYRGRLPCAPVSEAIRETFDAYVKDGWIDRDDRYAGLPHMLRHGVTTEFDFVTADDLKRRPYYQEFLAPFGLRWFAGVKIASAGDIFILSLQRTIEQGPFAEDEQKACAELSAQLAGATAMASALGFARADAALEAFQASGTAVVLTDRLGNVFRANAAAEALLGSDLRIRNGRLAASDRDATAGLDRAIHALLWDNSDSGVSAPVSLPRGTGRPVVAYVLRLTSLARDILAPARAAVLLIDTASRHVPTDAVLRQVFALTPAEARLAAAVADGTSVIDAAGTLGIAYDTARTQLRAVFAKTRTSRQGELVALLSRLIPPTGGSR